MPGSEEVVDDVQSSETSLSKAETFLEGLGYSMDKVELHRVLPFAQQKGYHATGKEKELHKLLVEQYSASLNRSVK